MTRLGTILGAIATTLALAQAQAQEPGRWVRVSDMKKGRQWHNIIPLPDGKALVVGGVTRDERPYSSAEVFDPRRGPGGTWTLTRPIGGDRPFYGGVSWVAQLEDGRVLVTGGSGASATYHRNGHQDPQLDGEPDHQADRRSFVFDPPSGRWIRTGDVPEVTSSGIGSTPLVLRDGRVLIAGGYGDIGAPDTGGSRASMIFTPHCGNPALGTWRYTRTQLNRVHTHAQLVQLRDGRVMCIGGAGEVNDPFFDGVAGNTEILDLATETWTYGPSMLPVPGEDLDLSGPAAEKAGGRQWFAASMLPDGRVMVAGGQSNQAELSVTRRSTEIFDPAANSWSMAGDMAVPRVFAVGATLRPRAGFVITGGFGVPDSSFGTPLTERFDPVHESWFPLASQPSTVAPDGSTAALSDAFGQAAARLSDGRMMVAGGDMSLLDPNLGTSPIVLIYKP